MNERTWPCITATGVILALAACGGDQDPIRSVETQAWTLAEPTLQIGSLDGPDDAFSRVQAVAVDDSGRPHVLLPQEGRIAVFTADGTASGSIGRPGEGPGEFGFPAALGFVGDTLWVLDARASRTAYFLDGEFLKSEPHVVPDGVHPERRARVAGVLAGGTLLLTDQQIPSHPPETSSPSLILASRGETLDTLGYFGSDWGGGFMTHRRGGAIAMVRPFQQPFTFSDHVVSAPRGDGLLVVDQHPPTASESPAHFAVSLLSPSGDTLVSTLVEYSPRQMDDAHADSVVGSLGGEPFTEEEVREAVYLPETYPPVSQAVLASDGSVWLAREALPGASRTWLVLSPDGEPRATLAIPYDLDVQAITSEDVWAIRRDELDVPVVLRLPIIRG